MAADGRCVWMYAVAGDFTAPIAGELTGVGGSAVRPVRAAGLTAIVGDVDQPDFGEAALRRNLEDLDWLERNFPCLKACPVPRSVESDIFGDVRQ